MKDKTKFPDISSILDDTDGAPAMEDVNAEESPHERAASAQESSMITSDPLSDSSAGDAVDRLRNTIRELGHRRKRQTRPVPLDVTILSTFQACDLGNQLGLIVNAALMEYINEHKAELKKTLRSNLLLDSE